MSETLFTAMLLLGTAPGFQTVAWIFMIALFVAIFRIP
jgi:putative exporter of polyketide antibiotics